jgi:ABC-type bacteriocin/lantibiotic exporter with double-glycine peptidase domain
MDQLEQAALKCGAKTLGVQTTLDHLSRRKERFACIALLEKTGHFVLIYDVEPKKVHIVDPPRTREMARDAFQSLWNGKALLISTQPLGPLDEPGISPWVYVMVGVPCVLIIAFVVYRKINRYRSLERAS